ncbi:MAG: hypothetical protein IPG50_21800 [Myxococcales bacterium]|nr:hypothetical protein [Myxococcales bacterium]
MAPTVLAMGTADRIAVLKLAAAADVDPRSAAKALTEGAHAVRGRAGQKLAAAMTELGLAPPAGLPPASERAA